VTARGLLHKSDVVFEIEDCDRNCTLNTFFQERGQSHKGHWYHLFNWLFVQIFLSDHLVLVNLLNDSTMLLHGSFGHLGHLHDVMNMQK